MWWVLGVVLTVLALLGVMDWRARKRGHRFRDVGDRRREAVLPPGVESSISNLGGN